MRRLSSNTHYVLIVARHFLDVIPAKGTRDSGQFWLVGPYMSGYNSFVSACKAPIRLNFRQAIDEALFCHILNFICGSTVFRSVFLGKKLETQAFSVRISNISVSFFHSDT